MIRYYMRRFWRRQYALFAAGACAGFAVLLVLVSLSPAQMPGFTVASPADGQAVEAGSAMRVTMLPDQGVEATDATVISRVGTKEDFDPPFEMDLTIPVEFSGALPLLVGMRIQGETHFKEIAVNVVPPASASLGALGFEPSELTIPRILDGGKRVALLADFSDGVRRDVGASAEVVYSSSDSNVAMAEVRDGLVFVRARRTGTVVMTATYRGRTVTLPVRVTGTIPGDANRDCVVDYGDLAAIKDAVGVTLADPRYVGRLDADSDGVIDQADVTFVRSRLGTKCP